MNYQKLSERELINLINTSKDLKVVADAEDEFVHRHITRVEDPWTINEEDTDEAIMREINATWKPN